MEKKVEEKLHALDPRFKRKIESLFDSINESISMLYEVAIHDEKTGLSNNKFFENILDMEIEKAKRGYGNLSLIMIDIDFFKKINDKYGHIKADELLKTLANVLKKQVRRSDIAARFGGEEFAILLPETSLRQAIRFASRLGKAIHTNSTLKRHHLTVSGGVTQYKKGDSKRRFKDRADKALYHAKKTGRDKFFAKE
jgi:diguanylate cyclase (GGDEF)-like protein